MKKTNRMNKKKKSERIQKGVKYPVAVTADGQLVRAIDIEKESEVWKGVKFFSPSCETDDKEEMLFSQRKHKNGITKFFKHRRGYFGEKNEPDRYLHNYAEIRLKQRFDESKTSGSFLVYYYEIEKCPFCDNCKLKTCLKCDGESKPIKKEINLRQFYDTCEIEKGNDKYIADLLLTNSKDDSISPMFIEVFVTHKCKEEKINSGKRIIEIKINCIEDAEKTIIENAGEVINDYLFMHPENQAVTSPIYFYGFQRDAHFKNYMKVGQFSLTKKNAELFVDCKSIECKDVERNISDRQVLSISIPLKELNGADLYEISMAKAFDWGIKVNDCTLCKRYKILSKQDNKIDTSSCRLINTIYNDKDIKGNNWQIRNPFVCLLPYRCLLNKNNIWDKSKQAVDCHRYSIDNERISNNVHFFDRLIKHLWVNETLVPTEKKHVESPSLIIKDKKDKQVLKLLSPQECFSCDMYNAYCIHCLGAEEREGHRYVVCDYYKNNIKDSCGTGINRQTTHMI